MRIRSHFGYAEKTREQKALDPWSRLASRDLVAGGRRALLRPGLKPHEAVTAPQVRTMHGGVQPGPAQCHRLMRPLGLGLHHGQL